MRKLTLQFYAQAHNFYLTGMFFMLLLMGSTPLSAQSPLIIESTIVSKPQVPLMEGDSICYEFKITNTTNDDIYNIGIVIDPDVLISLSGSVIYGSASSSGNMLTGSGCYILSADDVGKPFIHNTFSASGSALPGGPVGPLNIDGDARFCTRPLVCIGTVNVSIDQNCLLSLTPKMLLDTLYYPEEWYSITITDLLDREIEDFVFTGEMIGKTYKYIISIEGCHHLPPCWGYLNVEYKLTPDIVCIADTLTCAQFQRFVIQDPEIVAVCSNPEIIAGESNRTELCGKKPGFVAKIETKYRIRDQFGNFSDTCTQEVYIREPDIQKQLDEGNIVWPQQALTFSCSDNIFNPDGSLSTSVSGVPRWDGVDMLTLNNLACMFFTKFEDTPLNRANPCDMIFLRRWIIEEWKCSGGFATYSFTQVISLVDNDAPSIRIPAREITRSINQIDCFAEFDLIPAVITDNCQPDSLIFVTTSYAGGTFNQNGGRVRIPLGRNVVYFRAEDICGNRSVDSMIINVIDNTPPVAICLRNYVVTITDTIIRVPVDRMDETSYDACGITRRCAVRMDDQLLFESLDTDGDGEILFAPFQAQVACGRDFSKYAYTRGGRTYIRLDDICSDYVVFCCADGGEEVPVILKFYDESGNMSICMVMVNVTDKTPATVTGLPDLEISCDFTFVDSTVFGWFSPAGMEQPLPIPAQFVKSSTGPLVDGTFFDNCGLRITELPVEITRDTRCGTGEIIRRFVIRDASGITQNLTQHIRITGDEQNAPFDFAFFPPDTLIEVCTSNNSILPANTGEPRIVEIGCSQFGLSYSDRYFVANNPSPDYCMKIERTWSVLDWCRDPRAENVITRKQLILVSDNTPPNIIERDTIRATVAVSGVARVLFRNSATDCVAGQAIQWSYVLRNSSNAIIAQDSLKPNTSGTVSFVTDLSVGTYRLNWTSTDVCGNSGSVTQVIVISARSASAIIDGNTITANGVKMDNVEVHLKDMKADESVMTKTNLDGKYAFGEMPMGGEYLLKPSKNDDILNGVSTLDLIMIQKHVIGLQDLPSVYALIAADINNDGKITALDLLELRSVLLGKKATFTNNESWRFFWSEQDILDAVENEEELKESYMIQELKSHMSIDFIGVKVGDVSGDARGNSALAQGRSQTITSLEVSSVPTGVAFRSINDGSYRGVQISLDLKNIDGDVMEVRSRSMKITSDNYFWNEESRVLSIVWYSDQAIDVEAGEALFDIVVNKLVDVALMNMYTSGIRSEIVTSSLEVQALQLNQSTGDTELLSLSQNSPNPWSDFTIFKLQTPKVARGFVKVYDVHNRVIMSREQIFNTGVNEIRIEGNDIRQNGMYFVEIEIGSDVLRQKMLRVN